tara:strand:+ start:191 stop:604 length:414 start_codon:yes stop_codon:yes gene_type:complete
MKNIWDWLKQINSLKQDPDSFTDKDWELWNSYMIHRFMSMNPDYLELVNEAQALPPTSKKEIYSIYREYIPKNNKWNKYIKSNIKKRNETLLEYLSQYWECSKREVKDYLSFLGNDEVLRILTNIGLDKKEIKPLLK